MMTMGMLSACLQSRYNQIIREEKGGSYGVSVNGTLSRQPIGTYDLKVTFQTEPGHGGRAGSGGKRRAFSDCRQRA